MLRQSNLSIKEVRDSGTVVLPPVTPGHFFDQVIQTETGRVNCCPETFTEAQVTCAAIFHDLQDEDEAQLKMISRRTNYMINSWFHNVPSLKRPKHQNNPLYIHPDDARSRNLGDGSAVRVQNDHGSINTIVALDDTLRPGTVAITHGWGYHGKKMKVAAAHAGTNANDLLPTGPGSYEKVSNQSFMTGIPVDVEAI
jgi:anaerobic selenocysteine-containing dehydrogenase